MKKIIIKLSLLIISINAFAQGSFESLGSSINSNYSEIRPTISADGKTLYYVVEGSPVNTMYKKDKKAQDIWCSTLGADGKWGKGEHLSSPLNNSANNAVFSVSPDGNRILIRGAYNNGKYLGRGVSMCDKTSTGWTAPQQIKIKGYSNMSVDAYSGVMLSNDGKTMILYFSEEKNSLLNDIYYSRADENGEWSIPKKISDNVSLDEYDEISPFMASDNTTLYFSSDRPGGKGSYDIWMTKRLDDSWEKWSNPVNMGDLVNTKGWEAYFSLDAKGEYGYIASASTANGHTDIGRIKLGDMQKPNSVVLVYGNIYNSITKQPMNAELQYDFLPNENNAGVSISNEEGKYKLTLPYGNAYAIRASADQFFSVIDTIDLSTTNPYKELHRDLYLTPVITDGKVMVDSSGKIIRVNIDNDAVIDSKGNIILVNAEADNKTDKDKSGDANTVDVKNNNDKSRDVSAINGKNNKDKSRDVSPINGKNKDDKSGDVKNADGNNTKNNSGQINDVVDNNNDKGDLENNNTIKISEGLILSTNNILFDFSKSILRSESYKQLEKVVLLMTANKNMQIELSAHTDAIGGYSSNLKLSDDRANAARQFLLSKGISGERIVAKGYGETSPVASNKTEEGRQLNRRLEFRVLKK